MKVLAVTALVIFILGITVASYALVAMLLAWVCQSIGWEAVTFWPALGIIFLLSFIGGFFRAR